MSIWQPWYCQPLESVTPIAGWVDIGVQAGVVVVEEVEVSVVLLDVVMLEVVMVRVEGELDGMLLVKLCREYVLIFVGFTAGLGSADARPLSASTTAAV